MKEGNFFSGPENQPPFKLDENWHDGRKITKAPFPKSSAESLKKDPVAKEILSPELLPFGTAADEVLSPGNRGLLRLDETKEITKVPFGKSSISPRQFEKGPLKNKREKISL